MWYEWFINKASSIMKRFEGTVSEKEFSDAVSEIRVPSNIPVYLKKNKYRYTRWKDRILDYIQDVRAFMRSKQGDCDDFAEFAREVCIALGYKAWLVGMWYEKGDGHAICIFEYENFGTKFGYISNMVYRDGFENKDEIYRQFNASKWATIR